MLRREKVAAKKPRLNLSHYPSDAKLLIFLKKLEKQKD